MTKTQKQRDKQIRAALTKACESIKDSVAGFSYLTHTVDLNNEANTLKVNCYFEDTIALNNADSEIEHLKSIILTQLASIKLPIKPSHIVFFAN
ncbi:MULTISPECIES: hypothetical protein [unclassified Pseudoalteromonas]|uniref:hypothetical protein n=1 Tax=unclassified Pseudoalteromonas TaxID=194690 RepID=UPI0011097C11|nr:MULTISPECIES: hypothetical protein [unclassified Pseudoalteromonas]TMN84626.1 hypothetical protein CWB64_04355 [Pseudoalteromonas sp. S410]TMN91157.1 hypothetical protein CWB62_07635 [Pseudoalteromonas sp. S408]TMN98036.1 hypothetical protein CWB61_08225 [Pseudoalteromonas sp. S407]TMO01166.1 hypothetical protein CWB63_05395 [Pseudoalteromonas sp. S409]TMO11725.1 hypothetical protein CWB57_05225 [Pseudoalteromonas sp. S186]